MKKDLNILTKFFYNYKAQYQIFKNNKKVVMETFKSK